MHSSLWEETERRGATEIDWAMSLGRFLEPARWLWVARMDDDLSKHNRQIVCVIVPLIF